MLEFLRQRQRGIMIFVAVLVIIAFTFLFNPYDPRGGASLGTTDSYQIYGQSVSIKDVRREEKLLRIAQPVGLTSIFGIMGLNRGDPYSPVFSVDEFSQNRRLIRRAAEEYGIHASDAEIEEATKENFAFQTNETYDPDRYQDTVDNILAPNGLLPGDLRRLIADQVILDKLQALLASNAHIPDSLLEVNYQRTNEIIHASTVKFNFADFVEDVEITEEEIANYYEKEKNTLLSNEKRKVEYVFFEQPVDPDSASTEGDPQGLGDFNLENLPDLPEIPQLGDDTLPDLPSVEDLEDPSLDVDPTQPEVTPFPEGDITVDPESDSPGQAPAETQETPSQEEPVPAEEPTTDNAPLETPAETTEQTPAETTEQTPAETTEQTPAETTEQTPAETTEQTPAETTEAPLEIPEVASPSEDEVPYQQQLYDFGVKVDTFYTQLLEDPSAMQTLAEEAGVTVTTTEPFTRAEPPSSPTLPTTVVNTIFNLPAASSSRVLIPVEASNPKGFYVVHVSDIQEPEPLTLEEAREQIEEKLRRDAALTKMDTAVKETRDRLTEALEAGSSFTEAATEAGLEPIEIPPFSASIPPSSFPNIASILPVVYDTVSGTVSEMISLGEDKGLVYVKARERAPDTKQADSEDDSEDKKAEMREYLTREMRALIFRGWLLEQRATAEIQRNEGVGEILFNPYSSFR